jgi:TolB protein
VTPGTGPVRPGRRTWRWLPAALIAALAAGSLLLACEENTPTEADEEAPTVQVTYPPGNTSVAGIILITAEATDNESVDRVEFYIDDELKVTARQEPYQYSWETLILENGSKHTIVARAYDPSGNMGTSGEVSVVVNNEINDPPTASILVPEDSTSYALGEAVQFSGEGRDALGTTLRDDQLSWFSDRDGYLGTGANLVRDNLSAAWHTITMIATDDRDLSSRDSVAIYISTEAELIQLTFGASDAEYPSWSPDGTRLVYASYQSGNQDLWIVSVAGGAPTRLTTDASYDFDPDWYGDEILFTSLRSGNADIWTIPETGGEAEQITDAQGWDTGPAWSPDGQQFVFSSQQPGGPQVLWVMPAGGGPGEQLTTRPGYEPDWYAGDVAFRSGDMNIYVTSLVSMSPVQITWDPAQDRAPCWSPDGNALAFTSDRSGNDDIWIWSFGAGRLTQLTYNSGRDYHPAWSPDGQWIAFSSDRNGAVELWMMQAP